MKLVNPYFIKQLPGRKSDVKDAQWIAKCTMKDLVRGSFVPSERIQPLLLSSDTSPQENKMIVLVAVARKLLMAIWHVLHDGTDHVDFNPDCKASANNG